DAVYREWRGGCAGAPPRQPPPRHPPPRRYPQGAGGPGRGGGGAPPPRPGRQARHRLPPARLVPEGARDPGRGRVVDPRPRPGPGRGPLRLDDRFAGTTPDGRIRYPPLLSETRDNSQGGDWRR